MSITIHNFSGDVSELTNSKDSLVQEENDEQDHLSIDMNLCDSKIESYTTRDNSEPMCIT